mgnify:FL=1
MEKVKYRRMRAISIKAMFDFGLIMIKKII